MLARSALALLLAAASPIAALADTAPGQRCLAVGGAERVVATVPAEQDCCTGRLQCSQYLSTTTVVRPAHEQHT